MNKKEKLRTSITDIQTFKACRRKWFLTSKLRMNLEPIRPVSYFLLGRGIHYSLSMYYGLGEHPVEAWKEWYKAEMLMIRKQSSTMFEEDETMLSETNALALGMLKTYAGFKGAALETIGTEVELKVPVKTPSGRASRKYVLTSRIDAIASGRGKIWAKEFKTIHTRYFEQAGKNLDNDEQATAYLYILDQLCPGEVAGILYTYLRKAVPVAPMLVRKGTALSQNKQQATTLELYKQAIKDNNFDTSKYRDFLYFLKDQGNQFVKEIVVKRHPAQLKQFEHFLYIVTSEMSRVKTLKDAYPCPPWTGCGNCVVRSLCELLDIDADIKHLVNTGYRPRRKWSSALQREEETV